MAPTRQLAELALVVDGEFEDHGAPTGVVEDVTHDSRQVGPGCLYVAISGAVFDGHEFVDAAVDSGATGVCVNRHVTQSVPEIVVDDTRRALGPLAAAVHDHPSSEMGVIGITGTNGKTTVAHYTYSIALSAGRKAGVIGTIHTMLGDETIAAVRTTPEASDFQRILAEMRDKGAELVAVEVSSHGLDMGRVSATRFAVAAFTNLSQDHLDFHGDMESYLAAKKKLFSEYEVGTAVVNVDDPAGASIAAGYSGEILRVGAEGDVRVTEVSTRRGRTSFRLDTPWGVASVESPIVGVFNVENASIAAACLLASGLDLEEVVEGLGSLSPVPGRFEVVSGTDPILVIVDYAHTPDGIVKMIRAAREMGRSRVIALIGAGGDRDSDKRPLMGAAVSAADSAIITSDNPRSEDPESIARSVLAGVTLQTEVTYELDRRRAIYKALEIATDGDVVLILGRGHEPFQEIGEEMLPFDDRVVARDALRRRRKSANSQSGSGSMG